MSQPSDATEPTNKTIATSFAPAPFPSPGGRRIRSSTSRCTLRNAAGISTCGVSMILVTVFAKNSVSACW
jgi:hypothetical protein